MASAIHSENGLLKRINIRVIRFSDRNSTSSIPNDGLRPQRSKTKSGKQAAVIAFLLTQVLFLPFNGNKKKSKPANGAMTQGEAKLGLREGWTVQTEVKVEAKGEVISTPQ